MRKDREEFRKKLIALIMARDNENPSDDAFPNSKERELIRYSYYIQHGIDTVHVAQMDKRVYNRFVFGIRLFHSIWQKAHCVLGAHTHTSTRNPFFHLSHLNSCIQLISE